MAHAMAPAASPESQRESQRESQSSGRRSSRRSRGSIGVWAAQFKFLERMSREVEATGSAATTPRASEAAEPERTPDGASSPALRRSSIGDGAPRDSPPPTPLFDVAVDVNHGPLRS